MTLTAKDHERMRKQARPSRLLKLAIPLFRLAGPLLHLPWIKDKIAQSYGGLLGTFARYREREDYENALKTALSGIEKYKDRGAGRLGFMNHFCWWLFMRYGVETLAAMDGTATRCEREQVIAHARNGIKPFKGYDVAYVFYCLARWRYESGDSNEAVKFAQVASAADRTWGEPDFILGWLALVSGGHDATEHLTRAVRKDPRIVFRISNDPICKTRPDILAQLKKMPELRELILPPGSKSRPG